MQLVRLTDQWSTFYKTRTNRLMRLHPLSNAFNKKVREAWNVECGRTQWKV